MNYLRRLSFIMMSAMLLASCSGSGFLNETQTTDLDEATVFSDSTYTAGFLNGIYASIHFDIKPNRFSQGGLQTACDEAEFKVSPTVSTDVMFATGTISAQAVTSDAWKTCYQQIRRCNIFLAHVDGAPMTKEAKTRYSAEARFLRAWYYFILLRHYGGVPLLGDKVYSDKDKIPMKRNTFAEVCEYIRNEASQVAAVLPDRRQGRDYGRAGAIICRSLLSRLSLYEASPLYNGGATALTSDPAMQELLCYPQKDEKRWGKALNAALDVMKSPSLDLYSYHKSDDGKDEPGWGWYAQFQAHDFVQMNTYNGKVYVPGSLCGAIFVAKQPAGQEHEQTFYPPTGGGSGNGGFPYYDLALCYPMKDGKPIGESAYEYDPLKPNQNRDPRFENSFIHEGSHCRAGSVDYAANIIHTYTGFGSTSDAYLQGTRTGLYNRKMCHRAIAGNYFVGTDQDYYIIRYAEILLNFAEAANEAFGPDYTVELNGKIYSPYTVLRDIHEYAGIEAGQDGWYGVKQGMSKEEMREAIRLERRIELSFEGHRFFDVRRWMIAPETDSKQMRGFAIANSASGVKTWKVVSVRQHVWRDIMYYWPLPYNEVVRSEELKQNPGYE